MAIKNLRQILPEIGKIKIGGKGKKQISKKNNEFRPPIKFDHFVITTRERDEDDNLIPNQEIMKSLGDKPKELRIMLIYDDVDLNFRTAYEYYEGKKLKCSGDGEKANFKKSETETIEGVCDPETCKYAQPDKYGARKCKISGVLTCILLDFPTLGGVYRFRTHGFYSVSYILNSLQYLSTCTNGLLRNLPLKMRFEKQATEKHGEVPAITVVFDKEMNELRQLVAKEAEIRKTLGFDIKTEEMKALAIGITDDAETEADVVEEYYADGGSVVEVEKGCGASDIVDALEVKVEAVVAADGGGSKVKRGDSF